MPPLSAWTLDTLPPELLLAVIGVLVVLSAVGAAALRRRRAARLLEAEADAAGALPSVGPPPGGGFFAGLTRSRDALAARLRGLTGGGARDIAYDELEEALIAADVGVKAATAMVEAVQRQLGARASGEALAAALKAELRRRLGSPQPLAAPPGEGPLVILVVGVNGSGKTTTIGKLAGRYREAGQKVLLAAGDTYRAGAIDQLRVWAERAGAGIVATQEGADPAAVIFDGLEAGKARRADVVICDTAGRLQAHAMLMDQLAKVVRVIKKSIPDAPHEVLLVLDGTSGQNAMSQARIFQQVVGVTGVALTKLDGTAKGGVVVAIREELGLPVKLVGLGEQIQDLRDFDPDAFVDALIG